MCIRDRAGGAAGDRDGDPGQARLTVVTHSASEAALAGTVAALGDLDVVLGVDSVLRVEGLGRAVSALGMPG